MRPIHQVLVSVAYGDAVTNEALELRKLLRQQGPSEIFAMYRDLRLPEVRDISEYRRFVKGEATLLAHYSIGHPDVHRFLIEHAGPLVLRYHNVTPPHYFAAFDPEMAKRLQEGRAGLAGLAGRTTLAIAVSHFNAADLREAGYGRIEVVPFLLDTGRLAETRPEALPPGIPTGKEPVVLFTGRVAPHKRHDLLIEAFHVLRTYLQPDAFLVLVGSFYSPFYRYTLTRLVQELALPGVVFTDQISDGALNAVYRRADVFVCLSEHEGFGAPVIEAMTFRLPVIAAAAAAVPETAGDAALLLDSPRPTQVAEAIEAVLENPELRAELVRRGLRRCAELQPERTGRQLVDLVRSAVA